MNYLKLSQTLFFVAGLYCVPVYAGGKQCLNNVTIVGVGVGYKEGLVGCPDSGNCVYLKYTNQNSSQVHYIGINHTYNLNDDDKGIAMLSLLKTALLTGSKISGWDHSGALCDDIDEMLLSNS